MSSFGTGLIPRDYGEFQTGYMAHAPEFPDDALIPEVEWKERIAERKAKQLGLRSLRKQYFDILKSLNQMSFGLCWAFSSTKAAMYLRVAEGQAGLILSAWYVAGLIKGWHDQGGFGLQSTEFIVDKGVPTMDFCPEYKRSSVKEGAVENALQHCVTEWWDGSDNPDKRRQQYVSAILQDFPVVSDLNDMGHSMCAIDCDLQESTYDNSWGGQGGPDGLYVGTGRRLWPDSIVIPRVVKAATV